MTDRLFNLLLVKLKVMLIIFLLTLISLFSLSFTTSRQLAADIWAQLGMTRAQGTDGIKQSFLNGYLYYYGAKNAKNVAAGNRGAITKDLLTYTRQYVSSDAFKKEYEQLRKDAKPLEPENKVRSKEEIRKEKIAETEKSIRDAEATMKVSADMARIMKPTVEMLKKTLEDYKKPDSKNIESYFLYEKNENASRLRSYQERLTNWEKEYPVDYREKIKQRLQKFIDLSATVDFTAELKQVGNKKKFVNPVYEGKAYDWKQIYRAGREVIEPARQFAEQWIKELNIIIQKTEPSKNNNIYIYGNG